MKSCPRIPLTCCLLYLTITCTAQQYPFVHYTPRDGLISNQIRNICQDSKGKLYFTSGNGLSVYDGARFSNYTSQNGLDNDIVNCVMEMGDDSVWVVTNGGRIKYLRNGRLKTVELKGYVPVINLLYKDETGTLYAATDQGLYILHNDQFIHLPLTDTRGNDLNTFIAHVMPVGDYFLIQRDNSMIKEGLNRMYLFDKASKKIIAETGNIFLFNSAPDGRVWICTEKNILSLDTAELKKGKLVLGELPAKFDNLKKLGQYYIFFDRSGNCWLGDQSSIIQKVSPDGQITSFTTASGLSMSYINSIFQDREGITWIATNNEGVDKLVNSNFSFTETPFDISSIGDISYSELSNKLLLYSSKNGRALIFRDNKLAGNYKVNNSDAVARLVETPHYIFGIQVNAIYKMVLSGNTLYAEMMLTDTTNGAFGNALVDRNGNLIITGSYLTAVVNGQTICRRKLNLFSDRVALDSEGNIWVATRENELVMYRPRPDDPANYLEQKHVFSKELSGISPRSITIDKNDNIWIGTRIQGIHVFRMKNGALTRKFQLDKNSGLSDNFIHQLACDSNNAVWACSLSGLDLISIRNGIPVIENITKQNNIYQSVFKVVFDNNNNAWGLVTKGLIHITAEKKQPLSYSPTLGVSMVKAGADTISEISDPAFSYKQNSISFYFSATSFMDEKQIQYSYRLHRSGNARWSEPSNNASISFIDLSPGNYTLDIKASFPAGRYPEQIISYPFSIAPPWWQTWWFRVVAALLVIGLFIAGFRFYYRRKLEKRLAVLEKQQAIEKERTRIATDMHDDLGAGLSRIKFLSQALSNKQVHDESIKSGLEKITGYSDEMTEKMGEIVWALNEKNDTLADLVAFTRSYALEYLANHTISCNVNTPMHLPGNFIAGDIRRNIFLSVKECLHNVVKHAGATQVDFSIQLNPVMEIVIHDNGKGIDLDNLRKFGNGIENIKKRMMEINGKAEFINEHGTKVILRAPSGL